MGELKIKLEPKEKKQIKSFCLTGDAVERLNKMVKKSGLSASEVVNQVLMKITA